MPKARKKATQEPPIPDPVDAGLWPTCADDWLSEDETAGLYSDALAERTAAMTLAYQRWEREVRAWEEREDHPRASMAYYALCATRWGLLERDRARFEYSAERLTPRGVRGKPDGAPTQGGVRR